MKKSLQIMSMTTLFMAMTGCALHEEAPTVAVSYNLERDARVRVYGNNGFSVTFWSGKECRPQSGTGGVRASGGAGQSIRAFLWASKDTRIGMPESNRSQNRVNGILAREFFTEYVVPAGRPVAFEMGFSEPQPGGSRYCNSFGGSFLPEAGQDYEVYMSIDRHSCRMNVGRIDSSGQLVDERIRLAPICGVE